MGTPAHFSHSDRDTLTVKYNEKWKVRARPLLWPAHSFDLNNLHFYLLSRIMLLDYAAEINDTEMFYRCIIGTCENIRYSVGLFEKVHQTVTCCVDGS